MSPSPLAALLLAVVLALLAWRTATSQRGAAMFRGLTETEARQSGYLRMALRSFAQFALGGVAILVLIGRAGALFHFPSEFESMRGSWLADNGPPADWSTLAAMACGIVIGALAIYLVWRLVLGKRSQPVIGNVSHLFPRNRAEVVATLVPAINAGLSEEIFFRLALPLLGTLATGSAWAGVAVASATFGLVHWYQGWKGVILTGLVGLILTSIYLDASSLIQPIVIHALVDVLALAVRPAIGLWLDGRVASRAVAG